MSSHFILKRDKAAKTNSSKQRVSNWWTADSTVPVETHRVSTCLNMQHFCRLKNTELWSPEIYESLCESLDTVSLFAVCMFLQTSQPNNKTIEPLYGSCVRCCCKASGIEALLARIMWVQLCFHHWEALLLLKKLHFLILHHRNQQVYLM